MHKKYAIFAAMLLAAPACHAQGLPDFGLDQYFTMPQDNTYVAVPEPTFIQEPSPAPASPPKDDLRALVSRHIDSQIDHCGSHMADCNGKDGSIRAFAKTIGNGRCNNRGYNCVRGVLEMCRTEISGDEITPMYYMACAAMLGKLGERDCAEGRATCAGQLQGALYFGLRASATCHKSYEKDPARQKVAKEKMDRFAEGVSRSVETVYVGSVPDAQSSGHILVWTGVQEIGSAAAQKVLELAFERLALHGASMAVGAASGPLMAFSAAMLFHNIAAAEMHKEVCLNWSSYYNGSYANVAGSVQKMTSHIRR